MNPDDIIDCPVCKKPIEDGEPIVFVMRHAPRADLKDRIYTTRWLEAQHLHHNKRYEHEHHSLAVIR